MTPYPGTCIATALLKSQLAVNTCGERAEVTAMQHVFARVHAVPMTTPHNAAMYAALLGNKHIKCDVVVAVWSCW